MPDPFFGTLAIKPKRVLFASATAVLVTVGLVASAAAGDNAAAPSAAAAKAAPDRAVTISGPLDSAGNVKVAAQGTQTVTGSVDVGNLPTDGDGNLKTVPQGPQTVNGTVGLDAVTQQKLDALVGSLNKLQFDASGGLVTSPQGTQPIADKTTVVGAGRLCAGGSVVCGPDNPVALFLDVSPFRTVRIAVSGGIGRGKGTLGVYSQTASGRSVILDTIQVGTAEVDDVSRVYEVPGTLLKISCDSTPCDVGSVIVFGRP